MQAFLGTEKLSKEIADKFFCPVTNLFRHALLMLSSQPQVDLSLLVNDITLWEVHHMSYLNKLASVL